MEVGTVYNTVIKYIEKQKCGCGGKLKINEFEHPFESYYNFELVCEKCCLSNFVSISSTFVSL